MKKKFEILCVILVFSYFKHSNKNILVFPINIVMLTVLVHIISLPSILFKELSNSQLLYYCLLFFCRFESVGRRT